MTTHVNPFESPGTSPTREHKSFWVSSASESRRRIPLLPVDADDLRDRLHVLVRVVSSLRNSSVRNRSQEAVLQNEVDAIRIRLGWRV